MQSGNVTFGGVTDADLIKIIQAKENSGGKMIFTPTGMQQHPAPAQGKPNNVTYSNVVVSWADPQGAKLVADLIAQLVT